MREPFLDFEWRVWPAYHWQDWLSASGKPLTVRAKGLASLESCGAVELAVERLGQTGPVLAPVLDAGVPRRYRPMSRENATLFRHLAEVDYRDRTDILAFATRYGLLGLAVPDQAFLVSDASSSAPRYHQASGESHLEWAHEICQLREALALTKAGADSRKTGKLKWLFDRHLRQVQGGMVFDADAAPHLTYAPTTLLAAIWLQLATAFVGHKRFPACKSCGRLFEISTDQTGFRSHREFCSDVCKTNDYRSRKRRALELARRGASSNVIAKTTDTDKATVLKWLAARDAKTRSK